MVRAAPFWNIPVRGEKHDSRCGAGPSATRKGPDAGDPSLIKDPCETGPCLLCDPCEVA